MVRIVRLLALVAATGAFAAVPTAAAAAPKGPRGWVLAIHGGAWTGVGADWVETIQPAAARVRALGYRVKVIDYRPGYLSLTDVVAAYDRLARDHPKAPICALGESAGGHLALMLATRRRSLDCVVADAAPSNFLDYEGSRRAPDVLDLAQGLFGADNLAAWSPAELAGKLRAPVLAAVGADDPLVPVSQVLDLDTSLKRAKTMVLEAGTDFPFVHTQVTAAAWKSYRKAEKAFLRRALR